jgi:YD repeat-containing protein
VHDRYDANSNIIARRIRDGLIINYGYDNLDRLVAKDLPGVEPDATYTYDLLSRAKTAVQSGLTITLNYDALSRVTSAVAPQGTVSYLYDEAGRRTRITYPGTTALYVQSFYDVLGNVTRMQENSSAANTNVLVSYAFDSLGRRQSMTYGNGVVQSYGFDANQRLSTLTHNPAGTANDMTASLSYNPAGQIDGLTKSIDAYAWGGHYNQEKIAAANGLNQLTAATPGAGQTLVPTLTYDSKGNTTAIGSSAYGYN